ncbi:hypothetical protein [Methylobacterium sp. Leaf399]|uniref:hypothetical protein n=1 Tax=Methylobacterium sp. Leaf399 TaxID=1736364 RepID=UPI0012E34CE8|nr:hypothetical protein [Methylobacterium sp. Leaf399]
MAEQSKPSVNAVVRVPDVTISRTSMEATVGPLDRFEASKASGFSYAQIGASEDCAWSDVLALIERVGPALLRHVERGEVGRPSLDVAFFVQEDRVTASLLVPNDVVAAIGRFGFDLEASAYVVSA